MTDAVAISFMAVIAFMTFIVFTMIFIAIAALLFLHGKNGMSVTGFVTMHPFVSPMPSLIPQKCQDTPKDPDLTSFFPGIWERFPNLFDLLNFLSEIQKKFPDILLLLDFLQTMKTKHDDNVKKDLEKTHYNEKIELIKKVIQNEIKPIVDAINKINMVPDQVPNPVPDQVPNPVPDQVQQAPVVVA